MSNVLKKVYINPLRHFHLEKEIEEYEQAKDDYQLAAFYHELLSRFHDRPLILSFIYAMIGFSTGTSVNHLMNQVEELI